VASGLLALLSLYDVWTSESTYCDWGSRVWRNITKQTKQKKRILQKDFHLFVNDALTLLQGKRYIHHPIGCNSGGISFLTRRFHPTIGCIVRLCLCVVKLHVSFSTQTQHLITTSLKEAMQHQGYKKSMVLHTLLARPSYLLACRIYYPL